MKNFIDRLLDVIIMLVIGTPIVIFGYIFMFITAVIATILLIFDRICYGDWLCIDIYLELIDRYIWCYAGLAIVWYRVIVYGSKDDVCNVLEDMAWDLYVKTKEES